MFINNKGDPVLGAKELRAIVDAESSSPSEGTSYISSGLDTSLANLRLQDDSSFFSIQTSAAPGLQNGKGAFASRNIQRGDLILSDKPLFCIPTIKPLVFHSIEAAVQSLSPTNLDSYLSLENSHKTCSCFPTPLLSIFFTNAFSVSESSNDGALCLKASRFNHSCSPNARYSFNPNSREIRIYALGTIPRGEEIFVSYMSGRGLYANPRHLRQANLRIRYHFTCACSICSLPEAESKMSDARRQKVDELWEAINRLKPAKAVQCLNLVVDAIRLLREEGYLADEDDFTNEAGLVCAFHSDWVSASYWAGLTYHTRVVEFGEDSTQAAEVRGQFVSPRLFKFAGLGPPMDLTGIRL